MRHAVKKCRDQPAAHTVAELEDVRLRRLLELGIRSELPDTQAPTGIKSGHPTADDGHVQLKAIVKSLIHVVAKFHQTDPHSAPDTRISRLLERDPTECTPLDHPGLG
jgi:hypothetical protein